MRRAAIVAMLIAAVVPAVAAGGTPTKREFIRQGDRLCAQTMIALKPVRARARAAQSLPTAQKWAAAASIWTDQIEIQSRFTARFRALGTPAGDLKAQRVLAGLDRGLVFARRVQAAFARRDMTLLASALPRYINFTATYNKSVRNYGFRVCGL